MKTWTPQRWDRIVSLFQALQGKDRSEREAVITSSDLNDSVREDLLRLLEQDDRRTGFLQGSPVHSLERTEHTHPSAGEKLAQYELQKRIGRGGMGEVFLAHDLRLDRDVALKILSPQLATDPIAKERFTQEAKTASALDHPNICTIYEIGSTDSGLLFIAMAYYDGSTVAKLLESGPLSPGECIRITMDVARGLQKAHEHGIVHRDIKPANVMVTRDGLVKILDFGIAKLLSPGNVQSSGQIVGTVSCMSPQQATGQPVDARTDVWSLGVLLYVMLSGRFPFERNNPFATVDAIVNEQPAPLRLGFPQLEADVSPILRRALSKEPLERQQSMADLLAELDSISLGDSSRPQRPMVAVVPLQNLTSEADSEQVLDGFTEEVIHSLAEHPGLRVLSSSTMFQLREEVIDIVELRERFSVDAVLEGAVRDETGKLQVSLRLFRTSDSSLLWSTRATSSFRDLAKLREDLVTNVTRSLLPDDQRRLPPRDLRSIDPEAYRLYLKGRRFSNVSLSDQLHRGIACFRGALAIQPNFAMAYGALATAHLFDGFWGGVAPWEAWPAARAAALEATRLDERIIEARAVLGALRAVTDWDWEEAERELSAAARLSPGDPLVRELYSVFCLLPTGRFEDALSAGLLNLELDPLSPIFNTTLSWTHLLNRQFEPALQYAELALELENNRVESCWPQSLAYLGLGRPERSIQILERIGGASSSESATLAILALSYAAAGVSERTAQLWQRMEERSRERYVPGSLLAWVAIAMGEVNLAFKCLEKACEDRELMVLLFGSLPVYDPLREDVRFKKILRRIGLS